ncbi:hypothetical protein [Actinomadura latina]|uniref:Uncharacterized protein n=1 Tax=Actinomadura latina TaxID=163603 RepID=A0A846YW55_9ACTN|nr:hypothetical protein [Actinomadura latina]NKZ04311.1 hypothetical protein [Actinomadura latina]
MSIRRLAAIAVALLALAFLAACGGGGGPPPQRARMDVTVLDDGGAEIDLHAAGRLSSDAEVRALTGRIAREMFPTAEKVRVHTRKARGVPFARAEIHRAYRTGRKAALRIDASGALRRLTAKGFEDTAMRLRVPPVPGTVRADGEPAARRAWRLREGAPAPVLAIEMRPRPARWYGAMALPALGALGVALGFFVRRRALALPAAGLAVATAVLAVVLAAGRQGANLGVAGLLGGTALKAASVAPLTAVPLGLPAAMLLAAVLARWLTGPRTGGAHEARPRDTGVFW